MKLTANKILVMHSLGIGGTVLSVPFLRNLREAFPAARIDLMLGPFSAEAIQGCPYVDRALPLPFSAPSGRGRLMGTLFRLKMMKNERYDAVFVLDRSLANALFVHAARVPRRIGYTGPGRGLLMTDTTPYLQDRHEVELLLDCLRALDIPIRSTSLEVWPSPENEKKIRTLMSDAGWKADQLKIVVHAAASLPAKQWPLERFAEVMKKLKEKHHARFVYTGSSEDAVLYQEIEKQGPFGGLNLCGITSVYENISLYRAADLFFGVDSGPMHAAAAVGAPIVALFGPTDERKWGPWGEGHRVITKRLSCAPCKPHKCRDNECMKRIGVDEALDAVENKIKQILPKVLFH